MNTRLLVAAMSFALLTAAAGECVAQQQTVKFVCFLQPGHVCQYAIQTSGGPVSFALPAGERREVPGITPGVDKYCVCDPGPVTPDCKAPVLGNWCLGLWADVRWPGENGD
jgi:hypothetical protein